jgi:membrane protein
VTSPDASPAVRLWRLLYGAAVAWRRDNAMRLSAAVAMYSILSLSPLLVITIKVAAVALSEEAATRQVERQVQGFLGPRGAAAVNDMIVTAARPESGILATVISVGVLLFTASGVFLELRESLNALWGIDAGQSSGLWGIVRERLLSLGMVFVLGFLLLVSQVVTTTLTVLSEYVVGGAGWVAVAIDLVASTLVITLLFAMLFRILPDASLSWREALVGAVVTAVLFKIGQYLQALYFTYGTTASAYGAAGSFVVVLLWVYYSCWILFYGAELIAEYVRMHGRRIAPAGNARPAAAGERSWQGGNLAPGADHPQPAAGSGGTP